MTIEATMQGHRVRLLASWEAPGVMLDAWEDLGESRDSWFRTGMVALVVKGQEASGEPFLTPARTYALGYVNGNPAKGTPVERFTEALRQERERALERLGGPLEFHSVG